jgi:hypothetical protein
MVPQFRTEAEDISLRLEGERQGKCCIFECLLCVGGAEDLGGEFGVRKRVHEILANNLNFGGLVVTAERQKETLKFKQYSHSFLSAFLKANQPTLACIKYIT